MATVVFDLGMVLSDAPGLPGELARRLGVDETQVRREYPKGRHDWDAGGPAADYWGPFLERLGVEATPALINGIARLDVTHWATLRPTARQLLRDCRTAGHRVAILSNAPHEMAAAIEAADWRADVDHVYVSATLGLTKPQPEIYDVVAGDLGPALWFVDDRQPNVDGALSAGWRAHLWADDADTRAWLETEGLLPGS